MTKIFAIDQSLNESGWYFDSENYGLIKYKRKDKGKITQKIKIDRLLSIKNEIKKLIEKFQPKVFVMEDYSFGARGSAIYNLGELGGMIKLLVVGRGLELKIVNPLLLKKFITGKGNARKDAMLLYVFKNFGFETTNHNIADAFSLHRFYSEYLEWKDGKEFSEHKKQCFEKFEGKKLKKKVK
ncbi:MAG: crossover junction endodeoxyribonuclease RuvC [Methanosarcinales archaeon]